ncbi:ABC-F family ATP-binding cassette domain-containing protein [Agathobacter rectalis]|uniref:ABC-F family ATP-binding cassette domain-containing protein n=1 Tax=Agathobacter rectalis TaxID=39491 RepID=A0AAW4WUE4_9FIRM|nr:ABC-F family ATP-binding cassette domain-containing protein [Agathobacter rectalis]MCC2747816.1 ABC-F family ATP-binding cassette domain-containing protein [Agathobacter rectalis]NSI35812.1 ABC-F family ATP-binding cassette domain-containing protein [Agathobacter rectalis]NSI39085.1 ABC-F family ATP-binding cassette domain-containing protein [Agathobacter rectalis]NSI68526.1 ABC-F family ATP-binding cassette domain-containing protein [Agathobacter rectalis]NSI74429.1 ABC-F family ATP-bindin
MLYQISNGAVAFGDDVILHSIDFEIRNTEKIAIVGRNGCGKTTLLKLISGEVEMEKLDSDESAFIAKAGNPEIGYLKQIAFDDPDVTLEQEVRKCFVKMDERKAELARAAAELEHDYSDEKVARYTAMEEAFKDDGGYYYEKEYEVMIRKFGFSDDERKKPIRDFSGGQQTKIAFIKLLLSKPDILLLDEPTNHLDVTTIEWLEGYLKSYTKAVVVVSHDRMFLDNVVDVVYEIEYGTARRYPGNYTNFIARKKENYDKQMKDHIAQQKEIERLQRMVTRFKGKPTKTSMAQSKQKAIDRMVIIEAPDKYDNKTFHANFQPEKETGNDVLYTSELAIGYDHPLSVVSLDLKRGEKLGILGGNGLGKSTFLKTIVGKIPALSGEYRFGTNVQIGYFDQQMAMYTSNKTVLDDFWDEYPNLTETEARNALGAFLFSGEDVFKNVNMLSGGEKVRLALCKILKTRPNVLVLDEPTNHMDIVGKETLESMLKDYKGTLIFVSHDRYFVKKVATQLLVFEDGTTNLYQFGYEQYQEKLDREAEESKNVYRGNAIFGGAISQNGSSQTGSDANRSTPQTGAAGNVGESTNANSAAQAGGMAVSSTGKAYYNPGKERSKIQKKVKKAEEDLAVKEAKLDELKAELMKPEYQSSYSKLTEIQNEIDALEEEILIDMEAWEELSSQLEALG